MRKARPGSIRHILPVLLLDAATNGVDEKVLIQILQSQVDTKTSANEEVRNLISDGLLKVASDINGNAESQTSPRQRRGEQRLLRLPKIAEIKYSGHDYYCFECCSPGELEHCVQCNRSFHISCYRKNPERPNYHVPSTKTQKNPLPAFSSDSEEDDSHETEYPTLDIESDRRPSFSHESCSSLQGVINDTASYKNMCFSVISEINNSDDKLIIPPHETGETKNTEDIVYMGEVRPPMRQRPTTTESLVSYKSEITAIDEDELCMELCTCCRLLKRANIRHPPHLQSDELCHLLGFTLGRNRSWLNTEVAMYMNNNAVPSHMIQFIYKLLFRETTMSLDYIVQKQKEQRYSLLFEFLVDILDMQNNVGVFFGYRSHEYECTKYYVRDITHDIAEIRRCPDCFRYSHERHSPYWFAMPCVQRHELVFAKHSSYPYWPAKVIRMLPNKRHDVRFFGGSHSRALIEDRLIKPIDTDIESLKLNKASGFQKAMHELHYHMALSAYSPSQFSFHADKVEMERIIHTVLSRGVTSTAQGEQVTLLLGRKRKSNIVALENNDPVSKIRHRRKSLSAPLRMEATRLPPRRRITNALEQLDAGNSQVQPLANIRNKSMFLGKPDNNEQIPVKRVTRSSAANLGDSVEIKKLLDELLESKRCSQRLSTEVQKLESKVKRQIALIDRYKKDKLVLKRKQWCYWCHKEALFLCCFKASYCSKACQRRHWTEAHHANCHNKS